MEAVGFETGLMPKPVFPPTCVAFEPSLEAQDAYGPDLLLPASLPPSSALHCLQRSLPPSLFSLVLHSHPGGYASLNSCAEKGLLGSVGCLGRERSSWGAQDAAVRFSARTVLETRG